MIFSHSDFMSENINKFILLTSSMNRLRILAAFEPLKSISRHLRSVSSILVLTNNNISVAKFMLLNTVREVRTGFVRVDSSY